MIKEIPKFKDGFILRAKTLQTLTDYMYSLPKLMRYNFCNGIVSGLNITEENGEICIYEGVISYNSDLFLIEKMTLPYKGDNELTYIKLSHMGVNDEKNALEHEFKLAIDSDFPKDNDIEICRFKLQKNAKIRYLYEDFEDFNTEFDTINIIHAKHSSMDNPTLNLKLLQYFANEMFKLNLTNNLDVTFCMQVLSANDVINVMAIITYIEIKTTIKLEDLSNINLYKNLLSILQNEKANLKENKVKKSAPKRKILID